MVKSIGSVQRVVVFSGDVWEHACPVLRLTGPCSAAGIEVVHGNEWLSAQGDPDETYLSKMEIYPERIAQADLVIVQRNFPGHRELYREVIQETRRCNKKVVYELDDYLIDLPETHPDKGHYLTARSAILQAIYEADAVTASTATLAEQLKQYNPQVYLLPNYLGKPMWRSRSQRRANNPLIIGYQGGHSHLHDLEPVAPLLLKLLNVYRIQLRIKFWGCRPPALLMDHPNVEWIQVGLVSYEEFAAYFTRQDCDIFIAPLQDNIFNRCKSAIKYLECSILGVPGVYSDIAPYNELVRQGENGFLAGSLAEWETHLTKLITNPELRLRMGAEAQGTVRTNWMLADHAWEWAEVYNQVLTLHKPFKLSFDSGENPELETKGVKPGNGEDVFRNAEQNLIRTMLKWQTDLEQRVATDKPEVEPLANHRDQTYQNSYDLYQGLLTSERWKTFIYFLRLRQKLFPSGSRRARVARLLVYAYGVFHREGPGAFLRGSLRKGFSLVTGKTMTTPERQTERSDVQLDSASFSITPIVRDGIPCQIPAITILIVRDQVIEPVDLSSVLDWAGRQSMAPYLTVAVWERNQASAYLVEKAPLGREELPNGQTEPVFRTFSLWLAGNMPELLGGLPGYYVCLAMSDLLNQPQTYLEENLVTLQTENLAFTINLQGETPGWVSEALSRGCLPGDDRRPLMRTVIVKDCIGEDYRLNLSAWKTGRSDFPNLTGRVINHLSAVKDTTEVIPFLSKSTIPQTMLLFWSAPYLLVQPDPEPPDLSEARVVMRLAKNVPVFLHRLGRVLKAWPIPDERPTVFVIMPFLAVGGAETQALKVMDALKERLRFVVVSFEALDPVLGTTTDAFRQVTPYVYNLATFIHPLLYMGVVDYLVERFSPVAMWIANGTAWIYEALPEIKTKNPRLRIYNLVFDDKIGWINRYDLPLVIYLDGHLAVNDRIQQAYINKGANPETVYRIENGINPQEFNLAGYTPHRIQELKVQLGLPEGRKVITFAARLHPQKRPMDFVELARRHQADTAIIFLMVGDGPLADEVDAAIVRIGLTNIIRKPFYQPLSDILALTDVFVLPSEYEGMPAVVLEAQAMGRPVVVTDVGNNREVVEKVTGGGVVINRAGDIGALDAGVQMMLKEPPDPETLRSVTLSHFDISLVTENYYQIFMGLTHA